MSVCAGAVKPVLTSSGHCYISYLSLKFLPYEVAPVDGPKTFLMDLESWLYFRCQIALTFYK